MTLEEKIRGYANKGELVHLSIASSGKGFRAVFCASSVAAGYSSGEDSDPVKAIEKALVATPVRPSKNVGVLEVSAPAEATPEEEITETVKPKRSGRLRDYM
jgi:hypothetical protein